MQHDVRKLCFDILRAIADIRSFTNGLSLDEYRNDRLVKLAVERGYEIIGEALRRMEIRFASEFQNITDGRKIIDFRNLLIHGYDDVADEIVWSITTNNIQILESEIQNILRKQQ